MEQRYCKAKTVHETYIVKLTRDVETGNVVRELWRREETGKRARYVTRHRASGEIITEQFGRGGLETTKQYGPQKRKKADGKKSFETEPSPI